MSKERLDKIVSVSLSVSRKEARIICFKGSVTVEGKTVNDPSIRIDPENSAILIDGKNIAYKKHIYLMLNKPSGVLSAAEDKNVETVVDIVKKEYNRAGLFPVGRLDKNTTGLLIVTDDGDFAHNVISPKKVVEKEYRVLLDGELTEEKAKLIESGVTLSDGTKCRECKVKIDDENKKLCFVTITEGKYHQIKRMFGVVDLGVEKLHRMRIGSLVLDNSLDFGDFRELDENELNLVFENVLK